MLIAQLQAEMRCLEHKLAAIRDYAESHLELNPDNIELQGVLDLISRYEQVPADFNLDRPIVSKEEMPNEDATRIGD